MIKVILQNELQEKLCFLDDTLMKLHFFSFETSQPIFQGNSEIMVLNF